MLINLRAAGLLALALGLVACTQTQQSVGEGTTETTGGQATVGGSTSGASDGGAGPPDASATATSGGTTSTASATSASSSNGTSTSGGATTTGATGGATATSGATATNTTGSSTTTGGAATTGTTGRATTTATTGGATGSTAGATTTSGTTTGSTGSTSSGSDGGATSGLVGFGTDTPAGRGGTVIKVTNLNASGAGSLAAALTTSGARIIVFEVGGIIDLNLARLTIAQPFVTVAGQTAPSPGITIIRGGMTVTTHDVLIQHIRVRMGDAGQTSGFEPDMTTDGANAYNVVFDHVSVAWGVDENLSVSGPRFDGPAATSHRITISNSIIAEGLYDSIHSKGVHSMGSLIHDYCQDVAVIGNFYAHNNERNPWFKGFGTGVIVNNVVYNPGTWAMRLGPVVNEWADSGITPQPPHVTVVGNYMKYGANTPSGLAMVGSNSSGQAYVEDNIAVNASGGTAPITQSTVTVLTTKPSWPDGLVARPASTVVEWVMAHAGARPKDRDAVDARLVSDFRAGTGKFVNSQTEVGGYPTATATQRALTVPTASGVDAWLQTFTAQVE